MTSSQAYLGNLLDVDDILGFVSPWIDDFGTPGHLHQ